MVTRPEAEARLAAAAWLRREETQHIFSVLDGAGGTTRAVGGIVRDTLLGRERDTNDVDMASELTPDEVTRRALDAGIAAYPTGIEHGTITLRIGTLVAEVTTLREDIETDGRHAVVTFGTDWARDAARRDFTMNALYAGADGTLFDPLGGLDDCLAGRVRFIGDPDQRIAEDRLRVFRFFRFSASHGGQQFNPAGLAACTRAASDLGRLSAERVGAEMKRMLMLSSVAPTLERMVEAGVLALPREALRLMAAYEQRAAAPGLTVRLAILCGALGSDALQRQWRLANSEIKAVEDVTAAARLIADDALNEAAYRYPSFARDAVDLAAVTMGWPDDVLLRLHKHLAALAIPKFPLTGGDLVRLGYKPGKPLGAELARLERSWIDSGFAADRDALLAAVKLP